MKLFYYKPSEFGADLHGIGQVALSEAILHLDLYKETSFYKELEKNKFNPTLLLLKKDHQSLHVIYENSKYSLFLGHIGSIQSWGHSKEEIIEYVSLYYKFSHEKFFYYLVKENKHLFLTHGGIKGLYVNIMAKLIG